MSALGLLVLMVHVEIPMSDAKARSNIDPIAMAKGLSLYMGGGEDVALPVACALECCLCRNVFMTKIGPRLNTTKEVTPAKAPMKAPG